MKRLLATLAIFALGIILLFSRTGDRLYHPPDELSTSDPQVTRFMESHGWSVSSDREKINPARGGNRYREVTFDRFWLEFSDQLEFHDRRQLELVSDHLQYLNETTEDGIYLVVFVHGHNQNADSHSEDENVLSVYDAVKFNNVMTRHAEHLNRHFTYQGKTNIPRVVGLFIGWRGETTALPLVQNLTVGERAEKADALGLDVDESSVFSSLRQLSDLINAGHKNSRMLVLGHSLGGRLLSHAMLKKFRDSNDGSFHPLGQNTLVVGLETAMGADCFKDFFGENAPKLPKNTDPSFWLITSKDDKALNWPYWTASAIGLIEPCEGWGELSRTPIGLFSDYLTHELTIKIANHHNDNELFEEVKAQFPDLLYPKPELPIWTERSGGGNWHSRIGI